MSLNVKYEHKLQDIAFLGGHHIQYIPHLHRELELICLLEGDVIAYADSVRYELHAGDIFLTFPNQIHSYEKVTEETHVGFIFKPDLLPELMETFTIGTPTSPVIEGTANNPRIRALIDALTDTVEREEFSHVSELRRGYLLALCAELIPLMKISKRLPRGILEGPFSYSEALTDPIGLTSVAGAENCDASAFGWRSDKHSDLKELPFYSIVPWYIEIFNKQTKSINFYNTHTIISIINTFCYYSIILFHMNKKG
jgi:hypothetical protein